MALSFPALKTAKVDMARYDVLLLGYPTWWATMPRPVATFVRDNDLSGKLVMPFSSHGGTVFGESVSDLAKAAKGQGCKTPLSLTTLAAVHWQGGWRSG